MNEDFSSILLNAEEREELLNLIGQKCQSRASAVVQVFVVDQDDPTSWVKLGCGVAAFVKDYTRRSFYIQIFDMEEGEKILEEEIYNELFYKICSEFFHQFEGEKEIIGISFADEKEALHFGAAVLRYTKNVRKKNAAKVVATEQQNSKEENKQMYPEGEMPPTTIFRKSDTKYRTHIRKSQIGNPENFRHIFHVGLDTKNDEEKMLSYIMEMANIKPKELEDANNKQMFLKYIDDNGGMAAVCKVIENNKTRVEKRQSSLGVVKASSRPKIPISPKPSINLVAGMAPSTNNFLEPVPYESGYAADSKLTSVCKKKTLPPPPTSVAASHHQLATPPPPPPPPLHTPPSPLPARTNSIPEDTEEDIETQPDTNDCSRNDFLSEIRNPGFRLKRIEKQKKEKQAPCDTGNSIIDSLRLKLESIDKACRGDSDYDGLDSSGSDDVDSDDDDW